MNILYISGEDIPGDHGGSIHTWYVTRGWARLGHRVTVLCRRRPGQPKHEELEGIHLHRVWMQFRGKKIPILGFPALLRMCSDSYDAIVERYDVFGGLGAILSRWKSVPLLLEVNYPHLGELLWKWKQRHSLFLRVPLLETGLRFWEAWQFRQAAGAIATRREIVPEMIRDRTWLVHWGADPERFKPLEAAERDRVRHDLGIDSKLVVLFMGSFRPWHGVEILPDVVEQVRQAVPDVKFLLVGDGEGKDKASDEMTRRGLSSCVVFTGNWQHSRMPELLSGADVGIAPYDASKYQPLIDYGFFWSPAKLFEYASCGLPVVCSDYDLLSEIVEDGVTGKLVPPADSHAFSEAVIKLCQDTDLRRRMGENARRKAVDQFDWDRHAEAVAGILEQLIADCRRTSRRSWSRNPRKYRNERT